MAHILVVEDDQNNALVFDAVLKRIGGFEVTIEENVNKILGKCRSGAIDLIVMDVSLTQSFYNGENTNGLEISKILKGEEECKKIPIILATAHAMKGDKERFLKISGANDYVTKPIMDHDVFIEKVNSLLEQNEKVT